MRYWDIRDPIFGYIRVNELERELLDTEFFQRLRRIKQLGLVHLVYPGAEHSRFTHSLGTMFLCGRIGEKLREEGFISQDEVQELRLAGLLHDVGHGPFSHIYEDVLHEVRGMTHEDVTKWLILESELRDIISSIGYEPKRIAYLSIGKLVTERRFLNDVLAGSFCSDILDYLVRDSYFTGVEYGKIDVFRIVNGISVIDNKLAVDADALYALESFIIARYEMFRAVYFHKTVRAASIMLREAMKLLNDTLKLTNFDTPEEFLKLSDEYVLQSAMWMKAGGEAERRAKELIKRILSRRLLKMAYEKIFHTQNRFYTSLIRERGFREMIIEKISSDARISKDKVYVDFPSILSVPHYPIKEFPTFIREGERKEIKPLPALSILVKSLSGYMNIIRVYSEGNLRERVGEVSSSIFDSSYFMHEVSY